MNANRHDAAAVATVVIAILLCFAAFTWVGPVLRPFLVAVFLFYATQSAAKALVRVGLRPLTAYATCLLLAAACVPPIVMAFPGLHPLAATAVAGLLVLNRLVWIDFVEVRTAGRHLSLDPVVVFLWLAYWGWVWGVVGLLLAYPMLAAVRVGLLHFEATRGWAILLGDE